MRIEELTHELRAQADEAMRAGHVRMSDLRARRSRSRRRRAAGGLAAVALVSGGVLVSGPALHAGGDRGEPAGTVTASSPQSPSVTPSVTPSATPSTTPGGGTPTPEAAWRPVTCDRPHLGGCAVPAVLRYGGATYSKVAGGAQPLFAPNGLNRELGLSHHTHGVVLVGATGAGPGSRLEVTVGGGAARPLPSDRFSVLQIPLPKGGAAPQVVVRETGRPRRGEVLQIAEYVRVR